MRALVIYDSGFGNTAKIARVIGETLDARLVKARDVMPSDLEQCDLVIVGSPTQGGRPTSEAMEFVDLLPEGALQNKNTAAFDTRLEASKQSWWLRRLIGLIGYAAPKIARSLKAKGGRVLGVPAGFIVDGEDGPLHEGELQRAADWARHIMA